MSHLSQILIVEDERIPAEFLRAFLEQQGYEVIAICDTGEEAIRLAREHEPDIIFMDIMLKEQMSGCEAALEISTFSESKIIFLTAYYDQEMMDYALEAGAINYLLKPYRDKQILAAIEMASQQGKLTKSASLNEPIQLECGYRYYRDKERLYQENREVNLSQKSLALIHYLALHVDTAVTKEELSNYIYGEVKDSSTIRTLIFRLRQQLQCDLIENISGVGYKIVSLPKS